MTRDECLRMAKLKGYSFETACELATFINHGYNLKQLNGTGVNINCGDIHDYPT